MSNWSKARSFLAYKWSLLVAFLWLGLYSLDYFSSVISTVFPAGSNTKSDQLLALANSLQDDRYRLGFLVASCVLIASNWRMLLICFGLAAVSYFTPLHFLLFLLPAVVLMDSQFGKPQPNLYRIRKFGVLELLATMFFASLMLASSVTLFRVETWNYGLYMWCLAVFFLIPYLVWFSVWQLLGRLALKAKPPLSGFILVVLYYGYFFVTCRVVTDTILANFASKFDMGLGFYYIPALFTTAFLLFLPNPCKVQDPLEQAGWALAKPGFWVKFLLVGFFIKNSNRIVKGLNKDLIDDALVDGYHQFLPVIFLLLAAGFLIHLKTSKRYKIYRNVAAALVVCSVGVFFAFKDSSWSFIAENLWPYSTVVANDGRQTLERFGFQDRRAIRQHSDYLNTKESMVKDSFTDSYSSAGDTPPLQKKPHIFVFISDATSRHHLSVYGYQRPTSPNLEAFKNDAVLFSNAFSPASDTYQNVQSIFSGRYVGRVPRDTPEVTSQLCEVLGKAGYMMLIPGVLSGLGVLGNSCPSEAQLTYTGMEPQDLEVVGKSLAANPKSPHFVYIHVFGGHPPFRGTSGKFGQSALDQYDESVWQADQQFGQLVSWLKERKLYDDSLILFSADHGLGLGKHWDMGSFSKLYRDGIEVPLLVKVPGVEATTTDMFYSHVDFLPTLASLLGVKLSYPVHGINLQETLVAAKAASPRCVYSIAAYNNAYAGVCSNGQKVIWNKDQNYVSVYDLHRDPDEQNNLADKLSSLEFAKFAADFKGFLYSGLESYASSATQLRVSCGANCFH
jgi:membrane-anchored protein YejM (alkaline phosphatase superfamily)